jgi:hypothetical protein
MRHPSVFDDRIGGGLSGKAWKTLTIVFLLAGLGRLGHAQLRPPDSKARAPQSVLTNEKSATPIMTEMINKSEVIAVGTVTATRSQWNKEKTRIYTEVTLTVDEYMKGSQAGNRLTIVHPGGEVGEVGELYSETATFQRNEEVMVFASKDKLGNLRIIGGNQGKYAILTDKPSGRKTVGANRSLDDVKREIRNVISKQQQQR